MGFENGSIGTFFTQKIPAECLKYSVKRWNWRYKECEECLCQKIRYNGDKRVLLRRFLTKFFDIMVKKMIEALKKRYSNLGLSEEQLKLVAPMAILGLADDADEAAIDARASESYVSDMLKNMQSQADKIRSLEKNPKDKPAPKDNKGDEPTNHDDGKLDEVLNLLKQQKEENDALKTRLDSLEGKGKQQDFDATVARIGKELGLNGDVLDLCKARLSSDMDEKTIRDSLGAAKKTLIDNGVKVEEGQQTPAYRAAKEEAERKEAADWVKEHEIK